MRISAAFKVSGSAPLSPEYVSAESEIENTRKEKCFIWFGLRFNLNQIWNSPICNFDENSFYLLIERLEGMRIESNKTIMV